jgi:hypothetical protein
VIDIAIADGIAVVTLRHGKAQRAALLSPAAFARIKMQIRQAVSEVWIAP